MKLNDSQKHLLESRKQIIKFWPFAITSALASLLILFLSLLIYAPNLINPFRVIGMLRANTLPETQLVLLAGIAPILMIGIFLIMILMLLFLWVTIRRERRYIEIIESTPE